MASNGSDYVATATARNEPELLDADVTPGDIVAALERLKFQNGFRTIKMDAPVRDYLVSALRRKL